MGIVRKLMVAAAVSAAMFATAAQAEPVTVTAPPAIVTATLLS